MPKTGTTRAASAERGTRYSDGKPERVRVGRALAQELRWALASGLEAELVATIARMRTERNKS